MSEEAAQATEDAAKTRPAAEKDPVVMAIDVGGSHVKILTSAGGDIRRTPSGTAMATLEGAGTDGASGAGAGTEGASATCGGAVDD